MKLEGLEVWYRPGQGPRFFVRYGSFLFLVNLAANAVYLAAWQLAEGVGVGKIALGAAFALGGAVLSVLLERLGPIRNWMVESDLWHHPRKYIVPAILLLAAGAVAL